MMTNIFFAFGAGMIGFFGYEALRIYRHCIPTGKAPYPKVQRNVLIFTMLSVGIFSGIVAALWSPSDLAKALYIGFTIPTATKHIFAQASNGGSLTVDDIQIIPSNPANSSMGAWKKLKVAVSTYFGY